MVMAASGRASVNIKELTGAHKIVKGAFKDVKDGDAQAFQKVNSKLFDQAMQYYEVIYSKAKEKLLLNEKLHTLLECSGILKDPKKFDELIQNHAQLVHVLQNLSSDEAAACLQRLASDKKTLEKYITSPDELRVVLRESVAEAASKPFIINFIKAQGLIGFARVCQFSGDTTNVR